MLHLKLPLTDLQSIGEAKKNKIRIVKFMQVSDCIVCSPGKLNPKHAQYIIKNLNFGIEQTLQNKKVGLVTGPIQKSNIIEGGFKRFQGHTEWIKNKTKSKDVVMLLASKKIKVALATTHITLSQVPKNIKKLKLVELIKIVNSKSKTNFKMTHTSIKVIGLNQHEGKNGKHETEEA